jgi:hypothetical protein
LQEGETMPVKLNHYWTIIHSKKDDYNKFILKKFIPTINQLGMHAVAGWTVLVGAYSDIVFETVSNDLDLLEKALVNNKYKILKSELLNFVKHYKTKVLIKSGKIDTYSTDIHGDTIKFNQMWDVIGVKQSDYERYTTEEFYPAMEELGISVAREWEVLIGEGPRILCEGRVTDIDGLIRNLQSKKFRVVKERLKGYVETYESRILTFHIKKTKGYKSAGYDIVSV